MPRRSSFPGRAATTAAAASRSYDVQYRDGLRNPGALADQHDRHGRYLHDGGERGHLYHFQVRARDLAGNVQLYRGERGDAATFVNSVNNGGFEARPFFHGWTVSGEMSKSVTLALVAGGQGQWGTALLGSPDYGDAITPTQQAHVPPDSMAPISQTMLVPALSGFAGPGAQALVPHSDL